MATDQLQTLVDVHNEHQRVLQAEYGGKMSNQFVEEMKSSTLFQCDWGELLSAAPTALSLMGACWIAASQAKADSISLAKAQPKGGWKYLKNYDEPTLRSCLVDGSSNLKLLYRIDVTELTLSQCATMEGGRPLLKPARTWTLCESLVRGSWTTSVGVSVFIDHM